MALSGTFQSMSPSDLLQMLSWGSKTGMLDCRRDEEYRHIFLIDGDVIGVTSSRYKDRLGAMLLRMGCITEEQFNEIFDQQASNSRPLGELFLDEKILNEEELQLTLTRQAEEIIFDLLAWQKGEFSFEERDLSQEEMRLKPVVISTLLLEGARRIDVINRIRSTISDKEVIFKLNPEADYDSTQLSRPERIITKTLSSSMSLSDLSKLVNESEYSILTSLSSLLEKEIIWEDRKATDDVKKIKKKLSKLREMTELMEEKGWYHEALSYTEKILNYESGNSKSIEKKKYLEREIVKQAKLVFNSQSSVPSVRDSVSSINSCTQQLTPSEGFVFSRIDGKTDLKNLRYITGMPQNTLYIILHKFIRMGLIFIEDRSQKVRSSRN